MTPCSPTDERMSYRLHDITSQKIAIFTVAGVRTSYLDR